MFGDISGLFLREALVSGEPQDDDGNELPKLIEFNNPEILILSKQPHDLLHQLITLPVLVWVQIHVEDFLKHRQRN